MRKLRKHCAVVFDVDGVLVDSYRAHFQSWQLLGAETGCGLSEQQFAEFFGRSGQDVIRQFWNGNDLTSERIAELHARKNKLYREVVASGLSPMDGAIDLIIALYEAEIPLALASSGPRDNVDLAVDTLGVRWLFQAQIAGEDVRRGKPDPQIFRLAAQRLGVGPRRCAVIEDAPAGVAAAKAAGMVCIGLLPAGQSPDFLASADVTIRSLRALSPEVICQLVTGGHSRAGDQPAACSTIS